MEQHEYMTDEEYVIGSMVLDPEIIQEILEITKPSHFTGKTKTLFQRILEKWRKSEPVDMVSLGSVLGELNYIGRMTEIMSAIPSPVAAKYYAEKVRDKAALRAALRVTDDLRKDAMESTELSEIKELISKAANRLSRIASVTTPANTMSRVKDMLHDFYERLELLYQKGEGITGLPSGLRDLDKFTAGFQRKDLIVLAGRPSMGKTAFMNQLALNMSVKQDKKGFIASLEMGKEALLQRMASTLANVDLQRLRTGRLIGDDWERVAMAMGLLDKADITIDDQGAMTIQDIRMKARKVQREQGLDYIMIDYLQLIHGEGKNRYEIVTYAAQEAKNLAKEFDCPVICLSQLSRSVEQRQDKRPMLSDLRESGQIEQAADLVIFLHRDDYYDAETEKQGIVEAILAKQRNGPVGTVELAFLKHCGRFLDLEIKREPRKEPDPRRQWA